MKTRWRLIKFPLKHIQPCWLSIGTPKWVEAFAAKANVHTEGSTITLAMITRTTSTRMRTNWPTMWSLNPTSLWFLQRFQCWVMTAEVWGNKRQMEMWSIANQNWSGVPDPSSWILNNFMACALVIGVELSTSSSRSALKKQLTKEGVYSIGSMNNEFKVVLCIVYKLMYPIDFLVIKIFFLRLDSEELVVGPIVGVLGGEVLTILLWSKR